MNKQRALVVVRGAVKSLAASSKKLKDADAQRAVQKISSCLSTLEGSEIKDAGMQDSLSAFRASMQALYKLDIKAAVALCVALFDYILNRKIMPLREKPTNNPGLENWETLLKQLMDGVIDFLEDNPSKTYQSSFSASLYPALHDFYFRRAHIMFSNVRLSNTILDVILETVRDHPDNQKRLRDDAVLGGKVLGTLIHDVKHFLILENLLKLLGNLKPESTTSAGREQASKFMTAVFDPKLFPRHEELAKLVLSATASTWEAKLLQIVDILADMRAECPQPFNISSFEASSAVSAAFSNRIYLDYDCFLISYETDEQEDIFLVPFKDVRAVKKVSEPGNAVITISIQYDSAEQSPGTLIGQGTASFKLQNGDLARFFERLRERNLELPSASQRKQSRLKSPIPLNFDASGKSLTEKMDEFALSRPSSPEMDESKAVTPKKASPIATVAGSPSPFIPRRRTSGGRKNVIVSDDEDADDLPETVVARNVEPETVVERTDDPKTDVVVDSEPALQVMATPPTSTPLKRKRSIEPPVDSPKRKKSLDLSQPPTSPLKRKPTLAVKPAVKPPAKKYGRPIRSSSVPNFGESDLSDIEEIEALPPPPKPTKRVAAGMKGKDAKKGATSEGNTTTKAKAATKSEKKEKPAKAKTVPKAEQKPDHESKPKLTAKPKAKAAAKKDMDNVVNEETSRRSARVAKRADHDEDEPRKENSDEIENPPTRKKQKKNPLKSNHMPWNDLATSEVSTMVDDVPKAAVEGPVFDSSEPLAGERYVDTYEALKGLTSSDPSPPEEDITMVEPAHTSKHSDKRVTPQALTTEIHTTNLDDDISMIPLMENRDPEPQPKKTRSKERTDVDDIQEIPPSAFVKRAVDRSRNSTGDTDVTMVDASGSKDTPVQDKTTKVTHSEPTALTNTPPRRRLSEVSVFADILVPTMKPPSDTNSRRISDMRPLASNLEAVSSKHALVTPSSRSVLYAKERNTSNTGLPLSLVATTASALPASTPVAVMKPAVPILFTPRHDKPKAVMKPPRNAPVPGSRLRRQVSQDGLFDVEGRVRKERLTPTRPALTRRQEDSRRAPALNVKHQQYRPSNVRKQRPAESLESTESGNRTTTEKIIETMNEIHGLVVSMQVDRIEQPRLAVRMGRDRLLQNAARDIEEMAQQYREFYEEAVSTQGKYETMCKKSIDDLAEVVAANKSVSDHLKGVIQSHDKSCLSGRFSKSILPIPAVLSRKNVF